MLIKSIELTNFMRIKHAKIDDLHTKEVIGILGKGMIDPKRSNYLGKTTILEGMRYGLTGKSRASKKAQLIHFGEDIMLVDIELINDEGEIFHIRRGVDSKGKGSLEVGFGDKTREGQKKINELLGVDEKDFDLTFFFEQAHINKFMTLGPAEQKKMLMKWQKNDHWKEKEENVKADVQKLKDKIKENEIILRNLELKIGEEDDLQDQFSSLDAKKISLSKKISKKEKEVNSLDGSVKITESDYKHHKNEINELNDKISKDESKVSYVAKVKKELEVAKEEMSEIDYEKLENRINNLSNKSNEIERKAFNIDDKLDALSDSKSGICPILNESCDRLSISDKEIESMKEQSSNLIKERNKLRNKIKKLKDLRESHIKLDKKVIELTSQVNQEKNMKERIKENKNKLKESEKIIKNYDPEAVDNRKKLIFELKEFENELEELNDKLSVIKFKIKDYEEKRVEIEETREKLIKQQTILSDLQYLSFAFGKNGIPSLEIENSFEEIENEINYILEEIDESITIECKPDKELKTWEPVCLSCGAKFEKGTKVHVCKKCNTPRRKKRKDELQLNVIHNYNEMPFEMCSGGLKTIVSLSVRTALTMLLKRRNNTQLNTLFLDEIDSALDDAIKEKIKKIVSQVLIKRLGFKQIFWISHDKTISESVPHTILVKGYKDYSELDWV